MKECAKAVKEKHNRNSWMVLVCLFLGVWLLVSHLALGYRTYFMSVSDTFTGLLVILCSLFAWRATKAGFFCLWVICFAGLWLNFAPLLFWAKLSVEYLNDTVVGTLLTLFSIIIPGIPGKVEPKGHEIPAGWSYNPSSWSQRIPVIVLGVTGMFISRYLAAYQLGYISSVWDPVFGDETIGVISSTVSSYFPVADAGLGCFAYTIEVLLGLKGGENRWRTMPWMVVAFVLLVVPLGCVSIVLVILQPLIVGKWCFLCLCTALAMMAMIVFAVDELVAVFQFLHQSRKAGSGFWKTFWQGGDLIGTKDDLKVPVAEAKIGEILQRTSRGVSLRWNLILCALIGVGLMLSPYLFAFSGKMADIDHLFGALAVVIAILSLAEVIRILRVMNVFLGVLLLVLSLIFSDKILIHISLAVFLILLSFPRGGIKEQYGSWQKMIK
jgi:hypothetical protein